jgi:phage tail-like protein
MSDELRLEPQEPRKTSRRRRNLLVGAGAVGLAGAAGVLAGAATGVLRPKTAEARTTKERGLAAARFVLELETTASTALSFEGGSATGEVVVESPGSDGLARKHIGNVKYEDITVQVGASASKAVYDWVSATFARKHQRKSGAIDTVDFQGKTVGLLQFQDALLTEVGMPALDAASKDAAKMTLKFSPEVTRRSSGGGGTVPADFSKVQKTWLTSNFRLEIDGLDTSKVNKVEALTIKQKVVENPVGEGRDVRPELGGIEYPNLVIELPDSSSTSFFAWHEDFVIKGNDRQDKGKTGVLRYLSPDLKTDLFTLKFSGLGIFKCTPEKSEAGAETIRRVKAEMYVEEITFHYGQALP